MRGSATLTTVASTVAMQAAPVMAARIHQRRSASPLIATSRPSWGGDLSRRSSPRPHYYAVGGAPAEVSTGGVDSPLAAPAADGADWLVAPPPDGAADRVRRLRVTCSP